MVLFVIKFVPEILLSSPQIIASGSLGVFSACPQLISTYDSDDEESDYESDDEKREKSRELFRKKKQEERNMKNKCEKCDFIGKTAGGLKTHIRKKH